MFAWGKASKKTVGDSNLSHQKFYRDSEEIGKLRKFNKCLKTLIIIRITLLICEKNVCQDRFAKNLFLLSLFCHTLLS